MRRAAPADGRKEGVKFDKVTARVSKLCYGLDMAFVDPIEITRKVSSAGSGATRRPADDQPSTPLFTC